MMVLVMLRNSGNKIDEVNGGIEYAVSCFNYIFQCFGLIVVLVVRETSNDLNPFPIRFNYPGNRSTLIVKIKDADYLNAWEKNITNDRFCLIDVGDRCCRNPPLRRWVGGLVKMHISKYGEGSRVWS